MWHNVPARPNPYGVRRRGPAFTIRSTHTPSRRAICIDPIVAFPCRRLAADSRGAGLAPPGAYTNTNAAAAENRKSRSVDTWARGTHDAPSDPTPQIALIIHNRATRRVPPPCFLRVGLSCLCFSVLHSLALSRHALPRVSAQSPSSPSPYGVRRPGAAFAISPSHLPQSTARQTSTPSPDFW